MCGIVALVAPEPEPRRAALVREQCQLLAHRGPDDEDLFSAAAAPLTLGHRRLAIIDLSPDGRQPMRRGDLVVAFNGEVYNYLELREELRARGHAFRTQSDTEVLLAAFAEWGDEAPSRLNGMFAILLWDEAARRLLLVRDRFGVKPLYYLHAEGARPVFLCASEPKAVLHAARRLGLPAAPDRDVLARYLADAPTEDDERTFFAPLRRVLPGELLAVDLGRPGALPLRRRRWYALHPDRCPPPPDRQAGDERFRELFTDAVRLRLRSDVPVGTCLSGGLDSSAIVCVAGRLLGVVPRAFSAVYGAGDPADESRYIDAVVAHAGATPQRVDPAAPLSPDAFLAFLAIHDEPVGGTTVWAQHCVFRLAREHGVTVMLDGQGADEALTGYHGAFRPLWAHLLARRDLGRLLTEVRAARRLHGLRPLPGLLGAAWLLGRDRLPPPVTERYLRRKWRGLFRPAPGLRPEALGLPALPAEPPLLAAWRRRSPLHAYLYQLLLGSSLQTILRYEDRNSMAASIEARAPFLDYRVVEHCLAQPAEALVEGGLTKALLRRTLAGVLPELVRQRTDKIGFATPEARWLRGPLRPLLLDLLGSSAMAGRGLFDIPTLRALFAEVEASDHPGATRTTYALFKALNVELWFRYHQLSL